MEKQPSRSEAFALLCRYNRQESLICHGRAVEAHLFVFCRFVQILA